MTSCYATWIGETCLTDNVEPVKLPAPAAKWRFDVDWGDAMKRFFVSLTGSCLILYGCASNPEKIEAVYVSPLEYQGHSCSQLTHEMRRIGRRVQEATGDQADQATNDAVATGVGLVFWPALLFLIGDDRAEELARLKGEAEAVEQAAITKDCHDLLQQLDDEREALKQDQASTS